VKSVAERVVLATLDPLAALASSRETDKVTEQ